MHRTRALKYCSAWLFAVTLAAGARAACPSESGVYALKEEAGYTAALVPARNHASAVSRLYLRVRSPTATYWFTFGATHGYGGLFLESVTDPSISSAADAGPRRIDVEDTQDLLAFYPLTKGLDVLDVAPQAGEPAPEAFFVPELGRALWYRPTTLSGDPATKRETMPRGIFILVSCGRPNDAVYP